MLKSALEMSKKGTAAQATFTRAVLVVTEGTTMASLPSLAVAAASTMGNEAPPSVESRMSTDAQLTGGTLVLATFQATTSVDPWFQVTAVSGTVTLKGPAPEKTF